MHTKMLLAALLVLLQCNTVAAQDSFQNTSSKKVKLLVHITHGPENPTRAALGFLVAKSALDEGHAVSLFLAGDAVRLLQDTV